MNLACCVILVRLAGSFVETWLTEIDDLGITT